MLLNPSMVKLLNKLDMEGFFNVIVLFFFNVIVLKYIFKKKNHYYS